ncbi:MAG: hypothetical protein KC418_01840 [Anaerolineales bacterium]|nr:hypothetical protein [Anaerolineales bacterium]MCB8954541.1 hypothetical protein [Ardenticatenales bacterium]
MSTNRFSRVLTLVIFVFLLGIGARLAYADEHIEAVCTHNLLGVPFTLLPYVCVDHPNQLMGIGTSTPEARLHVDRPISVSYDAAQRITFSNAVNSIAAYGLRATSATLNSKGTQIGIRGETSVQPVGHPQEGSALGDLGYVNGWVNNGNMMGVQGVGRPRNLSNFEAASISRGLGGQFIGGPDPNFVLSLNNVGTYWVGGVYGRVEGRIDNTPARGAVAGVTGIDENVGTAQSYAGYFEGDVRVNRGYLQLDVATGAPPASACASQYVGRMVFEPGPDLLWICNGASWISK